MTNQDRLTTLSDAGVSIWLDDLSRERLDSGGLAELVTDWAVVGVTTNPTIFAAALAHGDAYDPQVRELAARGATLDEAVREITVADVVAACGVFRETFETTSGVDGRVSLEVDPGLAGDTDATVAQAIELWKVVDRPNLLVKIPATQAGLPAITRVLAEGISVNVTLIFSVERYRLVMDAYLDGLKQASANGHDLGGLMSVASFFVSRVDTEIDTRLDTIGTSAASALRGRAAVSNSHLAHAAFEDVFTGPRWDTLAAAGARPQRPLWASTGMKNPDYPDTRYVTELVIPGTVNTMPEKTLQAFADHGEVPTTPTDTRVAASQAQQVFDDLEEVGIDLTEVFLALENDGVAKFVASWDELADTVSDQLSRARP